MAKDERACDFLFNDSFRQYSSLYRAVCLREMKETYPSIFQNCLIIWLGLLDISAYLMAFVSRSQIFQVKKILCLPC